MLKKSKYLILQMRNFKTLTVRKVKGETTWSALALMKMVILYEQKPKEVGSGLGKEIEIDLKQNPFLI